MLPNVSDLIDWFTSKTVVPEDQLIITILQELGATDVRKWFGAPSDTRTYRGESIFLGMTIIHMLSRPAGQDGLYVTHIVGTPYIFWRERVWSGDLNDPDSIATMERNIRKCKRNIVLTWFLVFIGPVLLMLAKIIAEFA